MTYVPRSPRRATSLRAVVDDGCAQASGRVRDMSTSGLFVEASCALAVGRSVAVVPLLGDLDGERLPAEVARVGDRGVALRFVGLAHEHRQRLRQLVNGSQPMLLPAPALRLVLPPVPADAPVVLLTDEPAAHEPELLLTDAVDETHLLRARVHEADARARDAADEAARAVDEIGRHKREIVGLQARLSVALSAKARLHDEVADAIETVAEMERAHDALMHRVHVLEELLRRAMLDGWD